MRRSAGPGREDKDDRGGGSGGTSTAKPDRKPPKVTSPSDPSSAWTAKANKRVQFGYGLNCLFYVEHAVIVDVEQRPRAPMVESTKVMLDRTERRFSLNGALAWPLAAAAQQSTNSKRLAIFSPSSAHLHEHSESKFSRALFAELRRLEQIEGQNLKVESYGREQRRPFDSCSLTG